MDINPLKLKARVVELGLTPQKVADKLNITRQSWYNKLQDPDTFTHGELETLYKMGIIKNYKIYFQGEDLPKPITATTKHRRRVNLYPNGTWEYINKKPTN